MTKITTAGIGQGVVRKEDDALIRGRGRFSDHIDETASGADGSILE
jgi:hypothetical protein